MRRRTPFVRSQNQANRGYRSYASPRPALPHGCPRWHAPTIWLPNVWPSQRVPPENVAAKQIVDATGLLVYPGNPDATCQVNPRTIRAVIFLLLGAFRATSSPA